MSAKEQLEQLLQNAAKDNTLTKEALQDYHNAIQSVQDLQHKLEVADKDIDLSREIIEQTRNESDELKRKLEDLDKRESEVKKREDTMLKLETELACEKLRVGDHKEMFSIVFRNSEVRSNIHDSEDVSHTDPTSGQWVNKNTTKSYTEKKEVL